MPRLIVSGREERFTTETLLVGRRPRGIPNCRRITLDDPEVAATHAIVGLGAAGYQVEPYGRAEKGPILVGGERVEGGPRVLAPGDTIRIGATELRYERLDDAAGRARDDDVSALLALRLRLAELPREETAGILDGLEQLAGTGEVETLRRALKVRGERSPFGTTTIAQLASYVPNYGHSVGLLELLFSRVREDVLGYFARRVRRREDAEDLAQDALARLLTAIQERRYRPYFSFRTYLRMVCGGVLFDHLRGGGRRDAVGLVDDVPAAEAPRDPAERLDLEFLIAELRERLGDEAYEVFVLHHVEEKDRQEIARALGISRDTVRKRLASAGELFARLTKA